MSLEQIIALIAQQGGLLGLALFSIWMLNKVWDSRVEEAREHAAEYRELATRVTVALENQAKISTQLLERLR